MPGIARKNPLSLEVLPQRFFHFPLFPFLSPAMSKDSWIDPPGRIQDLIKLEPFHPDGNPPQWGGWVPTLSGHGSRYNLPTPNIPSRGIFIKIGSPSAPGRCSVRKGSNFMWSWRLYYPVTGVVFVVWAEHLPSRQTRQPRQHVKRLASHRSLDLSFCWSWQCQEFPPGAEINRTMLKVLCQ